MSQANFGTVRGGTGLWFMGNMNMKHICGIQIKDGYHTEMQSRQNEKELTIVTGEGPA
jgi:hypothetical protein